METSLKLRMLDGDATVKFHPRLTAEEYGELVMRVVNTATCAELQSETEKLASRWAKELEFECQ